MKKALWFALGVLLFCSIPPVSKADKMGMSINLNPNISSYITYNNTYYNISGGLNPHAPWLYECTGEMCWNTTAGDARYLQSYTETDPKWTANYTPCSASQKLYFSSPGVLGCSGDIDTDTWASNFTGYYTITQNNATYMNFSSLLNCGKIFGNASALCTIAQGLTAETDPKIALITANKVCTANSTGTGINCTADFPAETDPKWTANFTAYNTTWTSTYNASYDTTFNYVKNNTYYMASNPSGFTSTPDEVATLTANKVCTANSTGTGINCTATFPAETDPRIPLITANKWCVGNSTGTGINCTADAPSGMGTETDPQWTGNQTSYVNWTTGNLTYMNFSSLFNCAKIYGNATDLCNIAPGAGSGFTGILTANKLCYANSTGTGINCTADNPPTYNVSYDTAFNYVKNSSYYLASNPSGFTSTPDEVATLTANKICTANASGTGINCTQNPYLSGETDPKIALITANKVCTGNSTGTGINCTASFPAETDPQWTGNQSNYYYMAFANATFMNFSSLFNCGKIFGNASALCTIAQGLTAETDPKIALITANKVCTANSTGTGINCTADFPAETDPKWTANFTAYNTTWTSTYNASYDTTFNYVKNNTYYLASNPSGFTSTPDEVATLTANKVCTANSTGTGINCTATFPAETDPKLAVLTANKLCYANSTGTGINCTADNPPTTNTTYEMGKNYAINGTIETDYNVSMGNYVNAKIFGDAQVNDAITINGAVYVNTTTGMQTSDIYIGGASGWRIYVNGTGYLIALDV